MSLFHDIQLSELSEKNSKNWKIILEKYKPSWHQFYRRLPDKSFGFIALFLLHNFN